MRLLWTPLPIRDYVICARPLLNITGIRSDIGLKGNGNRSTKFSCLIFTKTDFQPLSIQPMCKFSLLFRMTNLNFKLENLPRGSTQSMLIAPDSREFCSILGRNLGFEFQNGNEVLCSFLIIEFDNSKTLLSYDVDDNDGNYDHDVDNDHVFNYTLYKHCSTFPFF